MRRIAIGNKPAPFDRPPYRRVCGLVLEAQTLGYFVHSHPVARSATAYPRDVLTHGACGAVRVL